jgi:hypothetical protein
VTDAVRHATPRLRAILAEQTRFVGLSIRREAAVGAALLLALFLAVLVIPGRSAPVSFSRELGGWFAALGFVAPLVVWRGLAGDGQLWTLPVDHRRHAAVGVAVGWLWMMVASCVLLLWLVAFVLVTGGHFGGEGTRLVLSSTAAAGAVDPRQLTTVVWKTPPWLWLVPFTAATVAYLLGSALVLATRHPGRWFVGAAIVVSLALLLGGDALLGRLDVVETVFTGGPVSRKTSEVLLTTGQMVRVWRLPAVDRWAAATSLALAIGIVALWMATLRLRERERALDGGARAARA